MPRRRKNKRRRKPSSPSRSRLRSQPKLAEDLAEVIARAEYQTVREILGEGRTAMKIMEIAYNAMGLADHLIENVVAEQNAQPPACKTGCSHCCHLPVSTTIPEVLCIANHLAERGRTDGAGEPLRAAEVAAHAKITNGKPAAEQFVERYPCPLLDQEDGRCLIYDHRPLACRGWNSIDAGKCEVALGDPKSAPTVPVFSAQREVTQGITGGIVSGMEDAGWRKVAVKFGCALNIALTEIDACDRWRAGEMLFDEAAVDDDVFV